MVMNDKSKIDLGLLEEDDEFEEFPVEGESFNNRVFDHDDIGR